MRLCIRLLEKALRDGRGNHFDVTIEEAGDGFAIGQEIDGASVFARLRQRGVGGGVGVVDEIAAISAIESAGWIADRGDPQRSLSPCGPDFDIESERDTDAGEIPQRCLPWRMPVRVLWIMISGFFLTDLMRDGDESNWQGVDGLSPVPTYTVYAKYYTFQS